MNKKSETLLKKFKILLVIFVALVAVMALDVLVFHTEVLNQICGIGVVVTIVIIVVTMVKTSNVWREEAGAQIEKDNEYLLAQYGTKVYCYEGNISKEEINSNPLFRGRIVYPKIQIEGEIQGYKFRYRSIRMEAYHENPDDHNAGTVYALFQGCSLQWRDERLKDNLDLIVCSPNFCKLTRFHPDKAGYLPVDRFEDGNMIYTAKREKYYADDVLKEIYYQIIRELKNPIQGFEVCLLYRGKVVEAYVYDPKLINNDTPHRMTYIENILRM